jgi:hypothetical protein
MVMGVAITAAAPAAAGGNSWVWCLQRMEWLSE